MPLPDASEIAACLGGAILAEVARPSPNWRDSFINVAMGIFAGVYGPAGLEIWIERLERAHKLLIAVCSLSGAIVIRSFLAWLSGKSFLDIVGFVQRLFEAARKPVPEAKT